MENYSIELTGFGTREQIAKSLRELADAIKHPTSTGDGLNLPDDKIDGTEFGPASLLTYITKA